MPDSIESLIYDEAQRGLALQPVLLNELRSRTGILLAVIGGSTSFLGAATINHHRHLGFWGVAALVVFGAAVACCLWALSPHRKWTFSSRAAKLIGTYCDQQNPVSQQDWTLGEVQRDLALHMGKFSDEIRDGMKKIQKLFLAAGFLLTIEIFFWIIDFAT